MKTTHKWYYAHFTVGIIALILLTLFTPREISGDNSDVSMFVSMPIIVFMIAFVNKLSGLILSISIFILSKVINVNINDYTQVETTIYMIQLFFTGIFWFAMVNILIELSETIWRFKSSFFKKIIALSMIIPSSYVLSLWISQLFLAQVGIIEYADQDVLSVFLTMSLNTIYALVGTSTLLILSYPYLNNYLSKTVINRVFQSAEDYTLKDSRKSVVRKNNRYWKVDDKMT